MAKIRLVEVERATRKDDGDYDRVEYLFPVTDQKAMFYFKERIKKFIENGKPTENWGDPQKDTITISIIEMDEEEFETLDNFEDEKWPLKQ